MLVSIFEFLKGENLVDALNAKIPSYEKERYYESPVSHFDEYENHKRYNIFMNEIIPWKSFIWETSIFFL